MSADYIIGIVDQATAPLRKIRESLGMVSQTSKQLDASGMGKFSAGLQSMQTKSEGVGAGMMGLAVGIGTAIGGLAASIARHVASMIAELGRLGFDMVKDSVVFLENSRLAFDTLMGSSKEGKKVMDWAIAFSNKMPIDTKSVVKLTKDALVAGFQMEELSTVMAGVGDVWSVFGKESGESVVRAMQKIMNTGKLEGETLKTLGEAGLNTSKMHQNLAALFDLKLDANPKLAGDQIQKLLESGKVSGRDGIRAILMTIQSEIDKGGPLGTAAQKASQTFEGLWSTLKSRGMQAVDTMLNEGGGTSGFAKMVTAAKSALGILGDMLDPASPVGQKLMGLVNWMSEQFLKLGSGKGLDLNEMIGGGIKLVKLMLEGLFGFLEGMKPSILAIGEAFGIWSANDNTEETAAGFRKLGADIGKLVGAFMVLVAAATAAGIFLIEALGNVEKDLAEFANGIGSRIVEGIGKGIVAGSPTLQAAVTALGELLPQWVKNILGIKSPSTVFAEIGLNTMRGFAVGIDEGAKLPASAVGAAVSPASLFGNVVPLSAIRGAGAAGDITVNVQVTASTGSSPAEIGAAVADSVEAQLVRILDRMSAEIAA